MKRTRGGGRDDSIGQAQHPESQARRPDDADSLDGSGGTGQPGTLSGPAVLAGIGGADVAYEPRRIAIVGLACRFADADDPASLLDLITTGRRAFRRIPPCRVDLADYYSATPGTPDATYSTRAALIEGWRFDRAAFGVSPAAFASADPAHWLALETAARALAAAGFPGGLGLPAQRTAAFIGNTLAGDVSRAASLRLRWPYTRRVIADALFSSGVPADLAGRVLRTAAARYLAPFPQVTADTLAGSTPGTIATRIGAHLGLRGGAMAVDAGGASALAAIASACLALSSGEIDAAVAGGVDLSLDPLDLVGLAKSGMLATGAMRIYDEHPTGFLPGEGAGMVLLMRSADARAARLPVYAEIVGWGAASAGRPEIADQPHPAAPEAAGLLLGLRQAFSMARIDPADVGLIEGSGTGVAVIDEAELTALAALRSGASDTAAFGAISANLGHTRAAAGAAGLIKSVLAIANGVLPPTTGVGVPHPMLRDGAAALRLPSAPGPWPDRARHASVSALGSDGLGVHLVLRQPSGASGEPAGGPSRRLSRGARVRRQPAVPAPVAEPGAESAGAAPAGSFPAAVGYSMDAQHPAAFLFQAPDRRALIAVLTRIADVAPWLSDAELGDLALQLSREATAEPAARVAIIAARQEQLARRASEAITLLPRLTGGLLKSAPGIIAADAADGRVTLLLSGRRTSSAGLPQRELARLMSILRWLDELGVRADAVVGHGVGELAGLVWAGCTTAADARALNSIRASVLAAPEDSAPGQLSDAIDRFARFDFRPPRRRLISGCTGTELAGADQVPEMLSAEVFESRLGGGGRLAEAVRAGAVGATLLLQTSQDPDLREAVGQVAKVPSVAIDGDPADSMTVTRAIAALFAAGAIGAPAAIAPGRPARPIDIWREQVFITNPCQLPLGQAGQPADQDRVPAGRPDDGQRAGQSGIDQAAGLATLARLATRTGSVSLRGTAEEPGAGQPASPVLAAPVTTWARCYVEQLRQPGRPVPAADQGSWRIYSGGCESLRPAIETAFRHDLAARRTLAVLGPLDAAGTSEAALRAAQDAIETGILVAICAGPDLTGLWASLHAEHPSLGITVVRAPMTSDGIAAAAAIAAAGAGEYRELAVEASGAVREPVMAPVAAPGGGSFPLGPDDVVLVSRAAGAAGLALAQVIACSGAAIAIIGGRQARQDEEVIATLEQLRRAGARVSYEAVDTADRTGMLAAIRRIEGRLGSITAVGHAVAGTPRLPVADLTAADLDRLIRVQTLALDQIVSAVRAAGRPAARTTARTAQRRAGQGGGLRLIATFGSVVGRYGLAGESVLAVASQALAEHGERLAVASPGCAALHIDWPGWAQDGLGERADLSDALRRAGFAPMSITQASRLLLKVLASSGLPTRLALHGRVGIPAPRVIARTDPAAGRPLPGRFLGEVLAYYPGAELIAEATLTLAGDPYLADYRLDGAPVFPVAMALEAMAQAASALAGATLRAASRVELTAPVVLPAGPNPAVTIRVFALWLDDAITVLLRSDQTGYEVDHVRAVFAASPAGPTEPGEPADRGESADRGEAEQSGAVAPAGNPADDRVPDGRSDGTLDASMLYGPVWFQAGRFRRLAAFRPAGSRSATAVARGADDPGWFGQVTDGAPASVAPAPGLILGSAAISDACLQVVQGCVPHRRLAPVGCDAIAWSGLNADGLVTISARRAGSADEGEDRPAPAVRVPRPRSAPAATAGSAKATGSGKTAAVPLPGGTAESSWDVEARDATGRLLVRWQGLRMRDAGPLPRTEPWPAELLGGYLEHAAAELGLGPGFEVRVARLAPAGAGADAEPGWVTAAARDDGLAALRLRVRAAAEAGCAWQTVRGTPAGGDPGSQAGTGSADPSGTGAAAGPGGAPLTWLTILEAVERAGARGPGWTSSTPPGRLATADPAATRAALEARARALAACLGPAPAGGDVTVETRYVAGVVWLLVRSGESRAASVLLAVDGVDDPVVLALRAGTATRADHAETGLATEAGTAASRSSRRRKRAAAARTSGS